MKKKILLVDDEETLRWALHEALAEEGYNVDNTGDGVNALEFIRKAHYDLVISDLRMPTMGGLQLISEIKKIRPDVKSIIITAYGSIETVIEAMHIGVSDFITKPFKIDHMKSVIQRVLNDASIPNNNGGDKSNEGLKIEYDDPCRQTDTCFIAKDMAGTANHIFYDFVESGGLRAFLFGGVSHEVNINNLDIVVKTIFRYAVKKGKSPASLLNDINQYLCKNILQRFPVALFCAVLDKQRQTLFYSTYGDELTSFLCLPTKEVKMLESFPFPLNMFPGTMIVESSVSFISGSKLILLCNESLSNGLRNGVIAFERFRDVVCGTNTSSYEDMAKSIMLQLGGLDPNAAREKGIAVMVSSLEYETDTAWEEVISLSIPIHNYGKMMEHFDKKLSSIIEDNFKRYQIITSINEAVLNAASFAYNKDAEGEVCLKFSKLRDEFIIEVSDRGCGFDVQNYREPDVTLYNDLTRKSGRGIFLMRNLMDRVMIQSSKEIGTAVHMAKRVTCNEN
ncbi:MAG: response regulator [Candidatus Brocadia sp.]